MAAAHPSVVPGSATFDRLSRVLKVRSGEGGVVWPQVGLMAAVGAGAGLGTSAVDALFLTRFGAQALPYLYVALGVVNFFVAVGLTVLLGRIPRERYYSSVPFALAGALVLERAVLMVGPLWFYPVLWIAAQVTVSLQAQFTWGMAGTVVDPRQARRLFPLFSAGFILGAVLGGLAARGLVGLIGAENMLVLWAIAFAVAGMLARTLFARVGRPPAARTPPKKPRVVDELLEGFRFVRQSPLLGWMSASVGFFFLLNFLLMYPFSTVARETFPDANELAGFLATFQAATTGTALIVSLFMANRLFGRYGLANMVVVYPAIYVVGFAILIVVAPFPILVGFRWVQMWYVQGVALTAWQAMFSVVPLQRRDRVRSFNNGIPGQAGIVVAGLLLIGGGQALAPQQFFTIGLVVAAAALCTIVMVRRSYGRALVEALRAGWPHVFYEEEEPFGGMVRDGTAVQTAIAGLASPEPTVRRIAAEVLGNMAVPEAAVPLIAASADPDPAVRVSAVQALGALPGEPSRRALLARLGDEDADVRLAALAALSPLPPEAASRSEGQGQGEGSTGKSPSMATTLAPLLIDSDARVRVRAAGLLLRSTDHPRAQELLSTAAIDADPGIRAEAMAAMGLWSTPAAFDLAMPGLLDPAPVVRAAAAPALAAIDPTRALGSLVAALSDEERVVREAVARAAGTVGHAALGPLLAALDDPRLEQGALLALAEVPLGDAAPRLRAYARSAADRALADDAGRRRIEPLGPGAELLVESLRHRARSRATGALRALGLLGDRQGIAEAIDGLASRDAGVRTSALDAIEALADRAVVRPLLRLWDAGDDARPTGEPDEALIELLSDVDPWLRACAALAAAGRDDERLRKRRGALAHDDPDRLVREAAAWQPQGGPMDTLATLPLIERMLFLRKVPLFADLSPTDLKHVAAIATERQFADGAEIVREGEAGDEMFVIAAGDVRVLVAGGSGEPAEVARRHPGECVGEMAIISHEPRSATLVATGEVRTLCIEQRRFEGILRERPETGLAVMRELCHRLRSSSAAASGSPQAS